MERRVSKCIRETENGKKKKNCFDIKIKSMIVVLQKKRESANDCCKIDKLFE